MTPDEGHQRRNPALRSSTQENRHGNSLSITSDPGHVHTVSGDDGMYRDIVETSREGISVVATDLTIRYANPRMAELLGLDTTAIVGRQLDEFVVPDDLPLFYKQISARRAGQDGKYEVRLYRSDGVPVWCHVSAKAVCNADGSLSHSFALFTDITEMMAAKEATRESERRFRTVADFTYDWEFWVDHDGAVIYMSPSCKRITGYEVDEFLADPGLLRRIVHPDDQVREQCHVHGRIPSRETHALEFRIIRADGETCWIGHVCNEVLGEDGSFRGVRVSNRDITAQKRGEARLAALNVELEREQAALRDKNIALREILNHIEREREELRTYVESNRERLIAPLLRRLRSRVAKDHQPYVDTVEKAIQQLVSPFVHQLTRASATLTPREVEVCAMIKSGLLSKEIADTLGVSLHTVHKFRQRIRRKLGVANDQVDLAQILGSMSPSRPEPEPFVSDPPVVGTVSDIVG